jgi:hypothetical protein
MLYKTKESKSMFNFMTKFYYNSLYSLDNALTDVKAITIDKYQLHLVRFCHKYIKNYNVIYLMFSLVPKFLVVFVFLNDVFYLHKISYFYKSLLLLFLPLLLQYILYYYNSIFEKDCQYLSERITIYCYNMTDNNMTKEIPLSLYISDIVIKKKQDKESLDCLITVSIPFIHKLFEKTGSDMQKHTFNHKKALISYNKIIDELIKIYTIQYLYTLEKTKYDPFVNLCIYTIYCFTWSYILIKSPIPTEVYNHIETFSFILDIQDTYEPFSGLELDKENDENN